MAVILQIRRYACALLMGVISISGFTLLGSNDSVSQVGIIQSRLLTGNTIQNNIEALEPHIIFFEKLFSGSVDDIAPLLLHKNGYTIPSQKEIQLAIKEHFGLFPFDVLIPKMQSRSLRKALKELQMSGSYVKVSAYWEELKMLAQQSKVHELDGSFKELATIIQLFYYYLDNSLHENLIASRISLTQLLQVYNILSALPVGDTLREIDRFIERLADALHELGALAETDVEAGEAVIFSAGTTFENWLQSKWVKIPLALGIIIVKVIHYHFLHKNILVKRKRFNNEVDRVLVRPFSPNKESYVQS